MVRGRKPKGRHLRLVDGTHRTERHGDAGVAREAVEKAAIRFGSMERPKYLTGEARLDASREPAAIAFCELWKELRLAPANFQAAKHSQLRAYMSELGLTDQRNRVLDADKAKTKDEHFDD
ncbi:MAG: hypothetical protein JWR09_5798 [Mucilaginibacter sp.]|nr:hypothetical protein [Mucilaginibacter sp.]